MGKYRAVGKEVLFYQDDVPAIHIADCFANEAAHFLATMANAYKAEDGGPFNYADECEKKNSGIFTPENVDWAKFEDLVARFVFIAQELNLYKKLFFRGKTPTDLGMEWPKSTETSCHPFFPAKDANLIHGLLGCMTEAGEMGEILVTLLDGKPEEVRPSNVLEECGDISWYLERLFKWLGTTKAQSDIANIDKLHGRFDGEAYNATRDSVENRNLAAERERLQTHQKDLPLNK